MQGCDASILIATNPGNKILAEKDAEDNKDLRTEGFDTITRAKTLVESKCPGVVSCADILAIAARDFVHLVSASIFHDSHEFDIISNNKSSVAQKLPLHCRPLSITVTILSNTDAASRVEGLGKKIFMLLIICNTATLNS